MLLCSDSFSYGICPDLCNICPFTFVNFEANCIPFNICEHHGHPILTILEQKERTHCWGPHSKSQHLSIHGHHEHEAVNDASLSHSHHRKSGGEVVGQCWCSHTIYWKKIKSYVRLEIMGSSSITSWFYEDELDPINLRS